jgi:hypothetical protein
VGADDPLMSSPRTALVDRANTLVSLVVMLAVLGCVAIAVYPLFADFSLPRETDALSLYFWLSGENITGEEWLRRNAEAQQREWDEMYRQSPMFEFNSEQFQKGLIYQPDWGQFKQSHDWANSWQKSSSYP